MNIPSTASAAAARLEKLRAAIDQYRYEFHVLDAPTISEVALDSLKHELAQIEEKYPDLITPDSPSQRVAGKPLPGFSKVKHRQRMMSLADVFSADELAAWDARWRKLRPQAKTAYLLDLKLDGLAISLIYRQGRLAQAATRGDGTVGEDVTMNIRTIESIPLVLRLTGLPQKIKESVLSGEIEVRGEVVMLKKDFDQLNRDQEKKGEPLYANPRNVAAGTIRQLDPKMTASRKLVFFAWELITDLDQTTINQGYNLLKDFGFKTNPLARTCATLDEVAAVHQKIFQQRESLPFWIDGAVVKLNELSLYRDLGFVGKTPRAAVAWKFAAEQATTIVENIVVQVGRTGALTPVAHLQPVAVAGTTVSRATLHNADEVARLDVRIGDTVIIQKAGDIIPDIVEVIAKLRPRNAIVWKMPRYCPVCKTKVERKEGEAITYCPNSLCPARRRENLYHFVSKKAFDITGLGPSTVDVLVDEELVRTPADIFQLRAEQLVGLPLFATTKARKLIDGISSARRVSLPRLIYALGIRHVGEQTAIDLANSFTTIDRFMKASREEIARVKNIGQVVADSVFAWLSDRGNHEQLKRLLAEITIERPPKTTSGKLAGKSYVVTGTLNTLSREEVHAKIRSAGGTVSSSVSAKTTGVIVGAEPGSKASKAKKLGVPILSEVQFLKLLG